LNKDILKAHVQAQLGERFLTLALKIMHILKGKLSRCYINHYGGWTALLSIGRLGVEDFEINTLDLQFISNYELWLETIAI
jgi:hypothetical protein